MGNVVERRIRNVKVIADRRKRRALDFHPPPSPIVARLSRGVRTGVLLTEGGESQWGDGEASPHYRIGEFDIVESMELAIAHGGTDERPTALIQLSRCSNPPLDVQVAAEWTLVGPTIPPGMVDDIVERVTLSVVAMLVQEFLITMRDDEQFVSERGFPGFDPGPDPF